MAYYFGCIVGLGHRWWYRDGNAYLPLSWTKDLANIRHGLGLICGQHYPDGVFCPGGQYAKAGEQHEGKATLNIRAGHTLLAFWDRSVDHRHGSNSLFVLKGELTFQRAKTEAEEAFPAVWSRFKFPVVQHRG